MRGVCIPRGAHGPSSDGGNAALFVNGRLGVHALLWPDMPELRVGRRRHEAVGVGTREVADEMEVLVVVGGNGERLFHQAVGFVSISIRSAIRVCLVASHAIAVRALLHPSTAPLALHFTVGEEAAGHAACAPRLTICPSSHTRLSLVPHEDRAGGD